MKKNMGQLDRMIRILAVVAIIILYFTDQISGTAAIVLGVLALVFVITSFFRFCPLYLPFGISTIKKNRTNESRN